MSLTTKKEPILRVTRPRGTDHADVERIGVADVDVEFKRYPTFLEAVVGGLVTESGLYDDSDGDDYLCWFLTDKPDAVLAQWAKLVRGVDAGVLRQLAGPALLPPDLQRRWHAVVDA